MTYYYVLCADFGPDTNIDIFTSSNRKLTNNLSLLRFKICDKESLFCKKEVQTSKKVSPHHNPKI